MRALLFFLLLAGCSAPVSNGAQVDLNSAAERAQDNAGAQGTNLTEATALALVPSFTRYRCMDGSKIALRFDPAAQTLALSRDGKPVATLTSRATPTGFRYASGAWELGGVGDMATLSTPGMPPITCKAIT